MVIVMAELLGRRARWTAALVAIPGAAALFGVATSWAVHTTPATTTTNPPTSPAQSSARPPDPALAGAQREAAANRRELSALEKQLAIETRRLQEDCEAKKEKLRASFAK